MSVEYKSFDEFTPEELGKKQCDKCGRMLGPHHFYSNWNKEKYPDGKTNTCKKCYTMHINNFDPKTFVPLLEDLDFPYVELEWNRLLEIERDKNPHKASSAPVFGRYVTLMKLEQWRQYRFKDSEMLNEQVKRKLAGIDINGIDITEEPEKEKPKVDFSIENVTPEILKNLSDIELGQILDKSQNKVNEIKKEIEALDFDKTDLTIEDKQYLALKWGKLYKVEEWIKLEQFYNEMIQSFDIQTASHFDYLKKICKTSLKMEQALDVGDIEGFQKLSKVYDSLMKSANFTAIQNKEDANFFVSSIGEMVALCEEKGFITDFKIDVPKDIVDLTLKDMTTSLEKLVKNELGLGNMIEQALNKLQQINNEEDSAMDLSEEEDLLLPAEDMFEDVLEDLGIDDVEMETEEILNGIKRHTSENAELEEIQE